MPRTDRALRRCYLKRMVIEGDVELEARRATEPDIYSFSPREQNKGIFPVNPHLRERGRARSLTPPGRRRKPPVLAIPTKSSRKIRWSEDGDTIRTYSPYREESPEILLSPRYLNDLERETDKLAPIHKKPKKKKKKKKVVNSQISDQKAAEDEKRRLEELLRREREERAIAEDRKRKEREARIREIELQKQNNKLKIIEENARQERIKIIQEERWRAQLQETQKRAKKSTIKRSQSTGNIKQKKTSKKVANISREKQLKAITVSKQMRKPLHPRWNYVGDPTRKAYTTQQSSYLSDFHF